MVTTKLEGSGDIKIIINNNKILEAQIIIKIINKSSDLLLTRMKVH
jgi:hypothetical protein